MVDESTEGGAPPNGGQETRDTEVSIPPIVKTRLLRSRRQIYMQIVAAIVILGCGIVIGAGGTLLRLKENIAPGPMPPPGDIVRDMRERYDLTEEQAEKVKAAVKEGSERMRTIYLGIREKWDAEFKQISAEMKEILTPEQFKQWESDFKSRRRHRPGRFGPGGPGPGGRSGPGGRRGPGGPGDGPGGPGFGDRRGPGRPDYRNFGPERSEPNAVQAGKDTF